MLLSCPARSPTPSCTSCSLFAKCFNPCLQSEGKRSAPLWIVDFTPSDKDDDNRRILSDDAGYRLQYLLGRAGIKRSEIYLTNIVRCAGQKPKKKEITACLPHLMHDVLEGRPQMILFLGSESVKAVWGSKSTLKDTHGFPIRFSFVEQLEEQAGDSLPLFSSPSSPRSHTCWVMSSYSMGTMLKGDGWQKDDLFVRDLRTAKAYSEGREVLSMPSTSYVVLDKYADAYCFLQDLAEKKPLTAVDCETDSLKANAQVLDVGFCYEEGKAYVLPFLGQGYAPIWTPDELVSLKKALCKALQGILFVGQHSKYDLKVLAWFLGLKKPFKAHFDTMVAHHCIDENKPHNLTFLARWYLLWDKYDRAMKPYLEGNKSFADAPNGVRRKYLAHDVDATFRLTNLLKPKIAEERVQEAFAVEMALSNRLAELELFGIRQDDEVILTRSREYQQKLVEKLLFLRDKATETGAYTEGVFNPNSPAQLAKLLKAVGADLTEKTETGQEATGKKVLKLLVAEKKAPSAVAKAVQELRSYNKMLGTYLDGRSLEGGKEGAVFKSEVGGFLQYRYEDGFARPSYNASTTVTGRCSANDPPIQTVPRQGGIRDQFVPDDEDCVFLSCDYGKIELCILAWYANEEVMANELINKIDLHAKTAIAVKLNRSPTDEEFFKLLPEMEAMPNWKQQRAVAKGVSFGVPYGISAKGIVDANPEAFDTDLYAVEKEQIAQEMIDAYFMRYRNIERFLQEQARKALRGETLETYFTKRKRRFKGAGGWLSSRYAEGLRSTNQVKNEIQRQAQNFLIQSTASDELSRATERVFQGIESLGIPKFRVVVTMHDQLIFNVPKSHVEEVKPHIRSWMETTFPKTPHHQFEIPFYIDIAEQRFWGDNEY